MRKLLGRLAVLTLLTINGAIAVWLLTTHPEAQLPGERRADATWGTSTPTCVTAGPNGTTDTCTAGSTVEIDTRQMGSAVIWMVPDVTGTVTGGQICFDISVNAASGGTITWEGLSGSNGDTVYTCSSLGGSTFADGKEAGWRFPVQNFDRLRIRLASAITCSGGAGSCTIRVSLRTGLPPASPFTIVRQSDWTRLHATIHGYVANDSPEDANDFPLKMGGTAYQGNSEAIGTLSNLPNVSASADRATALMTPYNEQRVAVSDKLKIGNISAAVGSAPSIGTPNNTSCSGTPTACVVIPLESMGALVVDIPTATWTATTHFEASIDGVWWSVTAGIETRNFTYAVAFGQTCAGSCGGTWQFILQQGFRYFRVRASAYTSGTPQIVVAATAQAGIFGLSFIEGDVAHDGPDVSTRPVKTGGRATTSLSAETAVAEDDRVNEAYDIMGRAIGLQGCNIEDIVRGVDTDTAGDSSSVISAAGSGVKIAIYAVTIANTSASMATVDIRDGTGGSVMWTIPAPATSGATLVFPVPIVGTANTAVGVDPSAGLTTIITNVIGCKTK